MTPILGDHDHADSNVCCGSEADIVGGIGTTQKLPVQLTDIAANFTTGTHEKVKIPIIWPSLEEKKPRPLPRVGQDFPWRDIVGYEARLSIHGKDKSSPERRPLTVRLISPVDPKQLIAKEDIELVVLLKYGVQTTTLLKVRSRNLIGDLGREYLTA